MTHRKEIEYWAKQPDGTGVWVYNKTQAKWLLQKIPSFSPSHIWIVDDEWAELRKANAIGYTIQQKGKINHTMPDNWWNVGFYLTAFSLFKPEDFCIKPKAWYENIPEKGVICWVWDNHEDRKCLRLVVGFRQGEKYPFEGAVNGFLKETISNWKHAEPVKPEECWKGECE